MTKLSKKIFSTRTLANLTNMKETKKLILDGYKAAFDQALANAKTAAENYLREQKDARRAKTAE